MNTRLKVGLIVDDETLNKYDHDLAQWAQSSSLLQISHLIVQEKAELKRDRSIWERLRGRSLASIALGLLSKSLWGFKELLETRELAANEWLSDADRKMVVGEVIPGRIFISPQVSRSGFVHRFSDGDLDKIRAESFDLLIRCGSGILRGDILRCARLGILSFHHGDNRVNRGGPAGFWEVYHRWPKTGFIIQRLTEELDGGDVIFRGFVSTERSHLLNRALVRRKSYFHLRRILNQIAETRQLPPIERAVPYSGRLYVNPRAYQIANYILTRILRSAVGRIRGTLGFRERWGVSYVNGNWVNAALWRGVNLKAPDGTFLADPFVVEREGRTCIFVEEYAYRDERAYISAFEIGENGAVRVGVVLNENFHLSFPFIFEYQNTLYMCPESSGRWQIRIYRCLEFPLRWELASVAMENVSAADSMIFKHAGKWWLFTNLSGSQPVEHGTELHIFSAQDPLSGAWVPHKRNPVIVDPEGGRNGGLLSLEGDMVRVAQIQGFGSYGLSARLMQVSQLTDTEYCENPLTDVSPTFSRKIRGTHHMHSNGSHTVWDFKRWERI